MTVNISNQKIFCLSKDKIQRDENLNVISIHTVPRYDYVTALALADKKGCDISILCGEINNELTMSVIDIDDVATDGKFNNKNTKKFIQDSGLLGSMAEFSKSKTGLHIFVPLYNKDVKDSFRTSKLDWTKSFEYYTKERQVVIGGFNFNKTLPISHSKTIEFIESLRPEPVSIDIRQPINSDVKKVNDIINICRVDPKLNELWYANPDNVDQSSNDLALMTKLCYYSGYNVGNALSLFFESPYVSLKDYKHLCKLSRKDYMDKLIQKGCRK